MKKILILSFLIVIILPFVPARFAFAHSDLNSPFWTPGQPIVPCGQSKDSPTTPWDDETQPCDYCQLFHLLRHLIDFVLIAAAPVLATTFFIIAGVMMMFGGANPGMLAQGKRIFKDTMIGLLIVMLAWLITNTIIRTLTDQGDAWTSFKCTQFTL
jgi:hypothetical protein